jgi:hypothetical protein
MKLAILEVSGSFYITNENSYYHVYYHNRQQADAMREVLEKSLSRSPERLEDNLAVGFVSSIDEVKAG